MDEARLAGLLDFAREYPGEIWVEAGARHLKQLVDELVGLAHDNQIDEGLERRRVREGERPASDDERVAVRPLAREQGQPGQPQHLEHAGDLQLVGDREGEDAQL